MNLLDQLRASQQRCTLLAKQSALSLLPREMQAQPFFRFCPKGGQPACGSARPSKYMPNAGEKRTDSVRSIQRGLDVLSEVNRSGGIRASELAQRLGLARPTVYRMLETLEELGYVRRSGSDDRFRVTRKASSLGDGYDPGLIISEAASPVIGELSKRFLWPIDLTTYENAAMVVQETTHAKSPLSIDRGMIGRRLPMLRTSAGRAYLAFCSAAEREIIIKHIARIEDPDDAPFLHKDYLDRMLTEARARGFALRAEGEYNVKTSSIAVPVMKSSDVLGCISIIWIRTALEPSEAIDQFAAPMIEAATQLGAVA
jgi:IclR family mhp operon transcriptional activator